jgi:RNA polymerase sigma-70 factor (ECF subfamily)
MQRYQQSDQEAASAFIHQLSTRMFRFFLAQARDRSHAEDLLQDFWLRIHHARHTYRIGEPVLPWIYAVARRVQIDAYRRRSRISKHELQREELPEISAPHFETRLSHIADLLKQLPPAQRETVLLLKVSGLSLEETARAMGTSVGAVKQKAHRAYKTLRRFFGAEL